jgi:peptidoglycan/LPS O-acetylase OafA/YrhL
VTERARPGSELPHGPPDPDAPHQGPNLSYIPALDGVRGVAIVVIMGYHGGVFLTSGGFYSLDTFFALSGFLITSLLITEWQRRTTIRLGAFWADGLADSFPPC